MTEVIFKAAMAKKRAIPRLSAQEMEIMSMLWRRGPLTLREAHQAYGSFGQPVGYTTMQTRLNRLVRKGVVVRTDVRPAKYRAAVTSGAIGARLIELLRQRVWGGSIVPLVAHLVRDRCVSPEELDEIRRLITEAEHRRRSDALKEGKR